MCTSKCEEEKTTLALSRPLALSDFNHIENTFATAFISRQSTQGIASGFLSKFYQEQNQILLQF